MNPTQEQIKEFWVEYGFEQLPWGKKDYHYEMTVKTMNWIHPLYEYGSLEFLPRIDLNNLFKYAVPKYITILMKSVSEQTAYEMLFYKWLQFGHDDLALFWALWEVK